MAAQARARICRARADRDRGQRHLLFGFKPATFATWAKAVPDGFVFALKASRFCTNRKVLAEAGELIASFIGQGSSSLVTELGPILWQFMATKKFDADDFGAFLKLLPRA